MCACWDSLPCSWLGWLQFCEDILPAYTARAPRHPFPASSWPPSSAKHQSRVATCHSGQAIPRQRELVDGSLWYPENDAAITPGSYLPDAQGIPPKWLAEFPLSTEEFRQIMMTGGEGRRAACRTSSASWMLIHTQQTACPCQHGIQHRPIRNMCKVP
jgi:hypothetical protein